MYSCLFKTVRTMMEDNYYLTPFNTSSRVQCCLLVKTTSFIQKHHSSFKKEMFLFVFLKLKTLS